MWVSPPIYARFQYPPKRAYSDGRFEKQNELIRLIFFGKIMFLLINFSTKYTIFINKF